MKEWVKGGSRMKNFENVDLEFKEVYVSDIKKEVIAFANTEGGVLYVGIRKDGTVMGVENPDEVMLQLAGSLKDSIKPDIMPFVKIKAVNKEEKTVIEITVEIGSGRPYYLSDKGLKPSGVYVRRGSSSQPLSDEGIREMIVENSGKSYEKCRSMNQNLTFHAFEEEMKKRGLEFGLVQMRTLHMVNDEELYTNLALLLSDQCEHSIKLAVYQGRDKSIFRDRKEFSGSLLKQMKDAFESIQFYNKTKATFHGLERNDKLDYPMEAIRETLLNCIVHRDYSFSGSTLINLYDEQVVRQRLSHNNANDCNLFTLDQNSKKLILLEQLKDIVEYLFDTTEGCIFGELNPTSKSKIASAAISTNGEENERTRTNLISMLSDYTTLEELEKGILTEQEVIRIENGTLINEVAKPIDRFVKVRKPKL